jgi:outer membrane autotransporter protein
VILGGALGYVDTDTEVHGDGGGIDVKGYSLSAFVTYFRDKFWLDGIINYGSNDYDFLRNIDLPQPFQGQSRLAAHGQPSGSQIAIDCGGGYDASFGATSLSGFARLSYIDADLDGFTEEGAGPFNLILQGQQIESLLLETGLEVVWASSRPWGVLQPMLRGSVLHEFEDDSRVVIAGFAEDLGNNLFRLPTDRPDRDYYRLGAGLTATLARGRGLYLLYETDLARQDLDLYRLSAGLRLEF